MVIIIITGVQSAEMLAPSAFLASVTSTRHLQQAILPPSIRALEDTATAYTQTTWTTLSGASKPISKSQHIQTVQDQGYIAVNQASQLMSTAAHDVDRAENI